MSEEISRSRSPNSPKISLVEAVPHVEALYKKAGRSPIKAEIAAGVLGYNGITGSSAALLGALNQYGLIDRSKGDVQVTPLALRIIAPVSAEDKTSALREASLSPKVFADIHERYRDTSEDVLANQLAHDGFAFDVARRVSAAYKANVELAKLGDISVSSATRDETTAGKPIATSPNTSNAPMRGPLGIAVAQPTNRPEVLATFKIPIGSSEAELIFTGEKLEPADFDALADYVALFKKQYLRKQEIKKIADRYLEEPAKSPPQV
ncbi:MAG TPA: hypothetical protein VHE61_24805 [Opitutaceae bacterium]|nr:hypothetical protein [Opitutaceae bacterium]